LHGLRAVCSLLGKAPDGEDEKRALRKDREKDSGKRGIIFWIAQMVVKPQGQIDHLRAFGNDLSATTKTSQIMAEVAVVLFDGKGQIFAGNELVLGTEAMKTCPIVGQESVA
jgi:hypothetical protein